MSRNNDNNCGTSNTKLVLITGGASVVFSIGAWALSRNINNLNNSNEQQQIANVAGTALLAATALGTFAAAAITLCCKDRVEENHPGVSGHMVFSNPNPNPNIQGQGQYPRNAAGNEVGEDIFV